MRFLISDILQNKLYQKLINILGVITIPIWKVPSSIGDSIQDKGIPPNDNLKTEPRTTIRDFTGKSGFICRKVFTHQLLNSG